MTVWEGGLLRQPPSTGPSYVSLLLQRFTQRTTHSLKPISSIATSRMSAQVLPGCTRSCLWGPRPCFPLLKTCLLLATAVEGDHNPAPRLAGLSGSRMSKRSRPVIPASGSRDGLCGHILRPPQARVHGKGRWTLAGRSNGLTELPPSGCPLLTRTKIQSVQFGRDSKGEAARLGLVVGGGPA